MGRRSKVPVSRPDHTICPHCESREMDSSGLSVARCRGCGTVLKGGMLETLWQLAALSQGLGRHACECGHPEMRLLSDGVRHCPACGAEVLPALRVRV